MSHLDSVLGDLDQLMTKAQQEIDAARDRQGDPGMDVAGRALDGRIVVKLAADGRMRELHLADDVTSLPATQLAREIMTAANLAWAASRSDDQAAQAAAVVDPAVLSQRMREMHEQGMASMRQVTSALADVMNRIDRRMS